MDGERRRASCLDATPARGRIGPVLGAEADRSQGIYLVRAGSRPEAEAIAAADPLTAAGLCTFDLIEWHVDQALGVGPFTASQVAALAPE